MSPTAEARSALGRGISARVGAWRDRERDVQQFGLRIEGRPEAKVCEIILGPTESRISWSICTVAASPIVLPPCPARYSTVKSSFFSLSKRGRVERVDARASGCRRCWQRRSGTPPGSQDQMPPGTRDVRGQAVAGSRDRPQGIGPALGPTMDQTGPGWGPAPGPGGDRQGQPARPDQEARKTGTTRDRVITLVGNLHGVQEAINVRLCHRRAGRLHGPPADERRTDSILDRDECAPCHEPPCPVSSRSASFPA